jgi:anti-anti-sigma factor
VELTKREQGAVHIELRDGDWVVQVVGELDRDRAPGLEEAVADRLEVEARDVVIDLSAATFLDGGGLGAIDECRRRCEEHGRALWVDARMQAGVERVLGIVGLLELVRRRPD